MQLSYGNDLLAQIALIQMGMILFVLAIKYATLFLDTLIK